MIVYREPGGEVRITEQEAITRQKAVATALGYKYVSDDAALENFIQIHWAQRDSSDEGYLARALRT